MNHPRHHRTGATVAGCTHGQTTEKIRPYSPGFLEFRHQLFTVVGPGLEFDEEKVDVDAVTDVGALQKRLYISEM